MTNRKRKEMERRIRVRGVRRHPVDVRKLGHAIIALAAAQAEKAAATEHKRRSTRPSSRRIRKSKNA